MPKVFKLLLHGRIEGWVIGVQLPNHESVPLMKA